MLYDGSTTFLFSFYIMSSEFNSLTTRKQTTKFSSAVFLKNVKSLLYGIENSKTRGQQRRSS